METLFRKVRRFFGISNTKADRDFRTAIKIYLVLIGSLVLTTYIIGLM